MSSFINKRVQGEYFENLALNFLTEKGYSLLAKNFYSKYGEIDLILKKDRLILFVEVKQRTSNIYGLGSEAINKTKQKRLYFTAMNFIKKEKFYNYDLRFDAIIFDTSCELEWLKNIVWGDELGL